MPRVLLVVDDKKLLPLLERVFRYEGFEVLAAATGDEPNHVGAGRMDTAARGTG